MYTVISRENKYIMLGGEGPAPSLHIRRITRFELKCSKALIYKRLNDSLEISINRWVNQLRDTVQEESGMVPLKKDGEAAKKMVCGLCLISTSGSSKCLGKSFQQIYSLLMPATMGFNNERAESYVLSQACFPIS